MNLYVNWRSAFRSIKNNRKRSLLTMLGIVIGIASVITILAIGHGFEKDTIKNLTKNNSKNVEIQITFTPNSSILYESNNRFFQSSDLLALKGIEGVKTVDYEKMQDDQLYKEIDIRGERKNKQIQLISSSGKEVTKGRSLDKWDNEELNKVAVIDTNTAKDLFDTVNNALGRGVNIEGQLFKIVGVFNGQNQQNLFGLPETSIQIPKKTYSYYFKEDKNANVLSIILEKDVQPDKITTKIINKLKEKGSMRNLGDYTALNTELLTDGIGKILSTITYFVTAVAAISLFIAGVGVMNMMYISVSERTKEIGIRRALGATQRSIMIQFLLEGLTLTVSGGIIGYILGMGFAYGIGSLIKVHIFIDLSTILLAVGVSSIIGLIFSVMPASSAAKKDLIDILR